MMAEWNDVTGYSKGRRGVDEPRSWQRNCGEFKIVVTRRIGCDPAAWYLTCRPLYEEHELASEDIDEAKRQAVALVQVKLQDAIDAIAIERYGERLAKGA